MKCELDKSGNPKIQDTCHDLNYAIKCLRKTEGIIEMLISLFKKALLRLDERLIVVNTDRIFG